MLVGGLCPLVWSDLLGLCFYCVQLCFQMWVCEVLKTNAQSLRFTISALLPLGDSNFWRLQRSGFISWRFIYLCVQYSMCTPLTHTHTKPTHTKGGCWAAAFELSRWLIWAQLNNTSVHTWGPLSTSRAPGGTGWALQYFPPERPQPAGLLIAAPGPHSLKNKTTHGPHHIDQLSSSVGFIHADQCLWGTVRSISLWDGLFSSC